LATKDRSVIRSLGTLKDRESVETLINLLADGNRDVRREVIEALGKIGDRRAVDPLIKVLTSGREHLNETARALGELTDPRAIPWLIDAIRQDQFGRFDAAERRAMDNSVAWPLFKFGVASVEPLAAVLRDENVEVRKVAAGVLYNLAGQGGLEKGDMDPAVDALWIALADPEPDVRYHAAMTLGNISDARAVDVLIEAAVASGGPADWSDPSPYYPGSEYSNAISHLGRLRDPKAVEPMIKLLSDPRPMARVNAARALQYLRDPRGIPSLLETLKDDDPRVRAQTAQALGVLKAAEAVDPLIVMLSDGDTAVRVAAAKGLGQLGDRQAVEPLAARLEDEDFGLRMSAAIALMQLDDPRGVESIAKCLKDPDVKRRERAVTELIGVSSIEKLTGPLIESLNDPSIRVRLYAAGFLGRMKSPEATDALLAKLTDRENLQSILNGLALTGDGRALASLVDHLEDDDSRIRAMAAAGIGTLGDKEGVQPLVQHLKDESPEVRIAVLRALGTLKASEAAAAVRAATYDEDINVRSQAERTLRRLPSQ
jgi:HEAT repeat protein